MIKQFIKNHQYIFISIIINLLFMFGLLACFGTNYELSDDWFFSQNIVKGNYNYVFCNYFIQLISGLLQKIIYPFNAFILLQIICGFISLTTISYILLHSLNLKKGIFCVLILETIFAINFYSIITFTKTAAALLVAGELMLLWSYHQQKNLLYSFYGILLILLGSFYRFSIFYSVLGVFCFFIFACFLYKIKKPIKTSIIENLKKIFNFKTLLIIILTFTSVFSFDYISKSIIYSEEGMDYYKQYNSARSAVVDYDIPLYSDKTEEYTSINFSENDFSMLRSWYFDDKGYTDLDTLNSIRQMQKENKISLEYVIKNMLYVEAMHIINLTPEGILILSYLIISAIFLILFRKKSWVFIISITISIGLLYTYLWMQGRCNYRAIVSIWFSAITFLLYSIRFLKLRNCWIKILESKKKLFYSFSCVSCITLSFIFLFLSTNISLSKLNIENPNSYPKLENYIKQSNKNFALSCSSYNLIRNSLLFKNPEYIKPNDVFNKCIYFGSAYYAHPSYNKMLANINVNNLYTDIIDNDNLYFVDDKDITMFITYLNEQYGNPKNKTYDSELVTTVDGFNIYKIVTAKK